MSAATTTPTPVHDRILATAFDLFYRQGYRATGINQIIVASGVAKASFYDHFPSKEALLHEYLKEMAKREFADTEAAVRALPTPEARFFGPLEILPTWFKESDFRGCPFQNIVAEAPPDDPKVHALVQVHRDNMLRLFREVTADLIAVRPNLAHHNVEELANLYLVQFEGAIAISVAYRATWPVEAVRRHLATWLELA